MQKVSEKPGRVGIPGYERAVEFMSSNQLRSAMEHYQEALRLSPDNPKYLSLYGLCIGRYSEDFSLAIELCERAISLNPDDPTLRVNLGKVFRMKGDKANAHEIFVRAYTENKSLPSASAELSRMGMRRPPVLSFLPRSHWLNIKLGKLRAKLEPLLFWRNRGRSKRKPASPQESYSTHTYEKPGPEPSPDSITEPL